ncbi:MAG: tyrosine-type recombinase/integrase [Bacillaceae bacterium]
MYILEVFDEFLEDYTFSESTILAYKNEINRFISFAGNIEVSKLNKRLIKRYFMIVVSKYSPRTQRRTLAFIKSFTRYMMAYDYITEDITLQVKVAQINKDIRANYSIDTKINIYQLIESISKIEDKAIIAIALLTGLRLSEIEQLKWSDIYDGYIHVRDGKGNKDRYVVLSPTLKSILNEYYTTYLFDKRSYLFISNRGLRMSGKTISRRIKKYTGTNPHSCRVTFATTLIKNGCDVETLRANMGHASISTTQAYIDRSKLDAVSAAMQFIQ